MKQFDTTSTAISGYSFRRTHTGPVAPYIPSDGWDRPVFTVSSTGRSDGPGEAVPGNKETKEWEYFY